MARPLETVRQLNCRNRKLHPKYFVSNAPPETALEKLLRVAFRGWNMEHTFRVSKSEIGFGHFEGRSYKALMRHLTLCLLALGFVAEHTDRLRGGKPGDYSGAGMPSSEPALRCVAGEPPEDVRVGTYGGGHCLSPAA
jgi:SRSO17 transposase